MGKIYHRVGEAGFWVDERYAGRVVALKEWTGPGGKAEVVADADSMSELERKMGSDFWMKDANGSRTPFSHPICRITKKAPE